MLLVQLLRLWPRINGLSDPNLQVGAALVKSRRMWPADMGLGQLEAPQDLGVPAGLARDVDIIKGITGRTD